MERDIYPKPHEDLEIRVDFYKSTGKWKYGGKVNVGTARLYNGELPQAIVNNQDIIQDGWQDHEGYIVVIDDTAENWENQNYSSFNKAIFFPHEFKGLKRKKTTLQSGPYKNLTY